MTDKECKSCIQTIELLRRLAFNVHGVMDVIDAQNCEKIIEILNNHCWIPVKTRPMTAEEGDYYKNVWDADLSDDEAVIFDCPMPEDKQEIWVSTKNGYVFQDTCENDDGLKEMETGMTFRLGCRYSSLNRTRKQQNNTR